MASFTGLAAGLGGESAAAGRAASEQLKERIERLRASLAQRQTSVSEGELGVQQQYADIASKRELATEKLQEEGTVVGQPWFSPDGSQVSAFVRTPQGFKVVTNPIEGGAGPLSKEQQVIRAYKSLLNTPGLPPGTADAFLSKAFGFPTTTWRESKPIVGPDGKPHIYYVDDRNPANRIDAGIAGKVPTTRIS